MAGFTITLEIPALERLCKLLEREMAGALSKREAVTSAAGLAKSAPKTLPNTAASAQNTTASAQNATASAQNATASAQNTAENAPNTSSSAQNTTASAQTPAQTSKEPTENATETTGNAAEPSPALTLADIQKASAELRNKGKLSQITGELFPKFGIRKLSDLTPDKMGAFADDLRAMGATI